MNKELLERIERLETLTSRLEQAMFEIRSSCSCLSKDWEEDRGMPNEDEIVGACYYNGEAVCITREPKPEEEDHD